MSELGRPFFSDILQCLFGLLCTYFSDIRIMLGILKFALRLVKIALNIVCTYCLMSKCVARLPYLSARDYSEQVKLSILVSPRG